MDDARVRVLEASMDAQANLNQEQIAAVVAQVPGGAANVSDIYALAPLQEGMLFHHLLSEQGDTFILSTLFELPGDAALETFTVALQAVVDRHDILRTAMVWERLPRPVQVVCKSANIEAEPLELDTDRDTLEQIRELMKPGAQWIDLSRAPLARLGIVKHEQGWYALLQVHHITCDLVSWNHMNAEIVACYHGRSEELPAAEPYRNYVEWALSLAERPDAEEFFRNKLDGLEESTAPFGVVDVHGDGSRIEEVRHALEPDFARAIRTQARETGVSVARLFHAAWALVVARTSGRDDVVYGTVLLAALHRKPQARRMLGMSVNTLPLRLQLRALTARQLVERTHQELAELMNYQQVPLAVAQRCSDIPGTGPLFTSVLNYRRSTPDRVPAAEPSQLRILEKHGVWTNYPVTVSIDDFGEGLRITSQTDRRIGAERMIGYLTTALRSLLKALQHTPDQPALNLPVLTADERNKVVEHFNAARLNYRSCLIHELVEEWGRTTPNAEAVTCGSATLTYQQLNDKADLVARALTRSNVGPDDRVALFVDRGLDMIVGLLGILKAGSAYVPLDISYPAERLSYILRDSAPAVVLTQTRLKDSLLALQVCVNTVEIDACSDPERNEGVVPRASAVGPANLAYVIYTSGSTGTPKGVMLEHRNLLNLIRWHCDAFDVQQGSRCSCVASVGFDAATWEIWPTLAAGGTLMLASAELTGDVDRLLDWWQAQPLQVSFLPTPIAEVALSRELHHATLQTLLIGGDRLRGRPTSDSYALVNNYGPTEATVLVTSGRVSKDDSVLHIGRPVANANAYILDRHLQPVPVGVAGEIYIGGAGVARGYLNRPQLTAERFLADPFGSDPKALLYKTGDLGRWMDDGRVEFLGRNDDQVKIRGFRIELGEIEAQLASHAAVREAVVAVREDSPSDKRLVAYFVPMDGSSSHSVLAEELRSHLRAHLPDYMIPTAFVMLERFPLTRNGKLDRRALPAPDAQAYDSKRYEPPEGELEATLAEIWQAVLQVERVGRRDNFFELGGHSLLIIQLIERLRRVGLSTDIRRIFQSPTLADLAAVLTGDDADRPVPPNRIPVDCRRIRPDMLPLVELDEQHIELIARAVPGGAANIQDIFPLAPLQEGVLFHHLLDEGGGDVYVLPMLLVVESRQQVDALADALQHVVDRHDVLRTAVLWEDLPQPVQVVYRSATLPVEVTALDPNRDAFEQVLRWMDPERQHMNLSRAPLVHMQVAEGDAGQWYVMIQLHHIVGDGQSLKVLISELVWQLEKRPLPPQRAGAFRDHVARTLHYLKETDTEAFFRAKLGDVDEPTAPFGLLQVHGNAAGNHEASEECDPILAQRLRKQARRLGVSAATVFHAAWALVVGRTSGRDDIVFGTVLHGRYIGAATHSDALGMFINTLPLRLRLQDVTATDLVHITQQELAQLLVHEQASLVAAQRCSGIAGTAPLFSALLNYRHSTRVSYDELSRVDGIELLAVHRFTNYPVTLSVDDRGEGFVLTAQTERRVLPTHLIGYVHTALSSLLDALERAPETLASELTIVPESERQQVLHGFNATVVNYPKEKLVHELFEEQARVAPSVIAVVHGNKSLTYAQLSHKADTVAALLRHKAVAPDDVVALCAKRGLAMIVGVLGILKAGAAYLPLDPTYPSERLKAMVEDASPKAILIQNALRPMVPASRGNVVELAEEIEPSLDLVTDEWRHVERRPTPENMVYVIYTSGSTGRPKGTGMPHRAMVNLIEWHRRHLPLRAGQRVLQFAALSFDVAFQETFSTLCLGGTLVMIDEWVRRDANELLELLQGQQVERLFAPPMLLQSLAESSMTTGVVPAQLRDVITAGEQLRVSAEIATMIKHIPGCRLHNHYGPTETHVVTALSLTGDAEQWPALPPIGRPVANSQIYILDKRLQPVPIAAVGEVYIGGVNTARGYLHRPELSAQKFIADPFTQDAGTTMYRSGDLARWHNDGTIEYLGRNDDQVKIRGFRIELGEIESQLARHPKVREVAVVAREDAAGHKRLVAYVTRRGPEAPTAEELREHLKAVMPDHMIPSLFAYLENLPSTPSGKLDRRALPTPDAGLQTDAEFEAAQGEDEEAIATVWREVLNLQRVGRNDNFFALGGHSLLVLKALVRVNHRLGSALKVVDLYNNPTLRELAAFIRGRVAQSELVDLAKEAALGSEIVAHATRAPGPELSILLTGATGFIGRFLLAQLLEDTDAIVHCLVRAPSPHAAWSKLKGTMQAWDLWNDAFEHRIVAVPGDLRLPRLGMNESIYRTLAESVDTVYHCGTSMNHLETYAMARLANVESVREIVKFATRGKAKLINHISSMGVFSRASGTARIIDEKTSIDHERHCVSSGYAASKWVAEKVVMNAAQRGVACNIFRLGLAWADSQQGRYDELQREYRVFKSCLLSGFGIRNYQHDPLIPVDTMARAITTLAARHPLGGGTFHLTSPRPMGQGLFERYNEISDDRLELLPLYDWIDEIRRLHLAGQSLPVVPLVEFAFSMDRDALEQHYRRLRPAGMRIECANTWRELEAAGQAVPDFSNEWLRRFVASLFERDPQLAELTDLRQRLTRRRSR